MSDPIDTELRKHHELDLEHMRQPRASLQRASNKHLRRAYEAALEYFKSWPVHPSSSPPESLDHPSVVKLVRDRAEAVCRELCGDNTHEENTVEENDDMPKKISIKELAAESAEKIRSQLTDEQYREYAAELTAQLGADDANEPAEPTRKIRFGTNRRQPGEDRLDYSAAVALSNEHSVASWIAANETGGRQKVDLAAAWNALAAGLIHDDWGAWREARAQLDLIGGGGEGQELVPAPLAGDVIDLARAATPLFALGATTVPMTSRTLDVARVTGDPDVTAWHTEGGSITPDTAMTLDRVTFTSKTLPAIVKVGRELSEDAGNVGEVVRQALAGAIAVELTKQALAGDGMSNDPTGILNQSGVTTVELGTTDGADASHDDVIDGITAISEANLMASGALFAPRTVGSLAKLKDSQGMYLNPPAMYTDLPKRTTTAIPTNITVGTSNDTTRAYIARWQELLIGIRTQLSIQLLTERYADSGEVAFIAWMRGDVQLAHPDGFYVITGITN